MARIFKFRGIRRSVIRTLIFWFTMVVLISRRIWTCLVAHHYRIGIVSSVVLASLNIVVYTYSCQSMKAHFDPVRLPHGFVPVFPDHYFHGPDLNSTGTEASTKRITLEQPEQVDAYLHNHTMHTSLYVDVPPVVHIVWCDTGPFTFAHYLSVLAAFKVTGPSVIYLHLIREPELDPDGYFQFLPDLQRDLPPLVTISLKHSSACSGDNVDKTIAFMHILGKTGGIVINGRTILFPSSSLTFLTKNKFTIATQVDKGSEPLVLTAHANVITDIPTRDAMATFHKSVSTKFTKCENTGSFSLLHQPTCVYINKDIFPVNIFNSSSHFDSLARYIGYGSTQKLISQPADSVIVPNIVHYVWLGERELNFLAYLSLLSSIYVLRADAVYIHGDHKPKGELWTEFERHPVVKFIHRDFPNSVYGEPIKKFASHASDYLRADLLLRYGGVYSDWDVIFLQELPKALRQHKTTANVDWPETGAFPDVFNLGILVSAPGAPFLRHFLESYRWYLDRHWSYNAIHMPYKVYEKQPSSINVDRHLQVLCALNKCHATWLADYKEESVDHLEAQKFDWQKDAIAIHWTHPDPEEFTSQKKLLASDTVTGEIGKYVLKKARIII